MPRPQVKPNDSLLPFPIACVLSNRQMLWLRKCPGCGYRKPLRASVKTCSHRCAGIVASATPGLQRKLRARLPRMCKLAADARLRALHARAAIITQGLTPTEAYLLGRRHGYLRGWKQGRAEKEEADLDALEMATGAVGVVARDGAGLPV